ncbi:hypothetical protein MKZ38_010251 [Zalerion maritima]|uniref:Heterokaryon incompatibility domain-containing protein n=1 Tax=Zalerion maritima TaxID=339359 RepID=A0AAD5WT27_9PEZI|nr:hypothetical protein MKZ38_010251 [Zalerion maritima]
MGSIYSAAKGVYVWLGPSNPTCRVLREDRSIPGICALQEAVRSVFLSSDWSRLWIVQEFVLAQRRHFFIGTETFNDAFLSTWMERLLITEDVKPECALYRFARDFGVQKPTCVARLIEKLGLIMPGLSPCWLTRVIYDAVLKREIDPLFDLHRRYHQLYEGVPKNGGEGYEL